MTRDLHLSDSTSLQFLDTQKLEVRKSRVTSFHAQQQTASSYCLLRLSKQALILKEGSLRF